MSNLMFSECHSSQKPSYRVGVLPDNFRRKALAPLGLRKRKAFQSRGSATSVPVPLSYCCTWGIAVTKARSRLRPCFGLPAVP